MIRPIILLRIPSIFLLVFALAAFMVVLPTTSPQNSAYAKTKPAAYDAQKWREKKGAITNSDRERLAKFTAYLGGRYKDNDGRKDAAASLSIKGDPVFRKHLKDNRLELLDSIDKYTGLQVSLVRDKDTGRVFVLARGTEGGHETVRDVLKADLGSFYSGQLKIGKEQYETSKEKIAGWIKKHKGNVEVIGHSLGGAIAQRIFLDNAENIVSVSVFDSPGLELETVNKALSKPSQLKHMMNPDGSRKLNIFNVKNDIVGSGGGIMVPGSVVMAEGGALAEGWGNAHTKLIFGPDVKREPMDYYRYQSWRDRSGFIAEDVTKDLARAWFNITNFKSPIQNNLRDLLGRLADYENAILREVDRKNRDKWRKSKEKKRDKDKKPNLDKIVTAVIDKTQLDVEKGRKPPIKKKVVKKPKKEKPEPSKSTAPEPEPVQGLWGSYHGALTLRNADGVKFRSSTFNFTIEGTQLFGRTSGALYFGKTIDRFKGVIDGTYDPETKKILTTLTIKWTTSGSMKGDIEDGRATGKLVSGGFKGTWQAGWFKGGWSATGSGVERDLVPPAKKQESPELVGWDAYMCKTYTDDWDQMARMGVHCE